MAKRLASLALALILLLALMPGGVLAAGETASGTCGDGLTWTLDSAGLLTVSGSGAMDDWGKSSDVPWYSYRDSITAVSLQKGVTSIGKDAFYMCGSLQSVTIPAGVTSIGEDAFYMCGSLQSVTIPAGVTSIGEDAFYRCSSLTDVTIPDGVVSIGMSAFDHGGLTSVTIPDSVTSIDSLAFGYCTSLKSVTVGCGMTKIGYHTFTECRSLTSVNLPAGLTNIGEGAFSGCSALKSITIPDSVTYISDYAFSGCSALKSMTIPAGVTDIGYRAFDFCDALTAIDVASNNPSYVSIDGVLFDKRQLYLEGWIELIKYPAAKPDASYTVPDNVWGIKGWAFCNASNLTSLPLRNDIGVGEGAFYGCSGLTSIVLPNGMSSLPDWTFTNCSGLKSVTIPSSMRYIRESVFEDCDNLTDVYYAGSEEDWAGINISYSNKQLESATIHYNAQAYSIPILGTATASADQIIVEWSAVDGATKYAVYRKVSGGSWTLLSNAVTGTSYTDKSSDLTAGTTYFYTVKAYVNGAWGGYDSTGVSAKAVAASSDGKWEVSELSGGTVEITGWNGSTADLVIPSTIGGKTVTGIGEDAFAGCNMLTSVTIPDSVKSIGGYAFYNCGDNLTNVTLGSGVNSIGECAFASNSRLTEISVASGNQAYCSVDGILFTKDKATLIAYPGGKQGAYSIPIGVTDVGAGAFFGCWNLTGVTIPGSVENIGDEAFTGCWGLTSVTIPDGVASIGDSAFFNCPGLTSMTIPASVTSIAPFAFAHDSSLTEISVASGNQAYCSVNGVLFNKDKTTLIACPGGKQGAYSIPNSVKSIAVGAFSDCGSLTSVTIPNSVTSIGYLAFYGCSSLKSVTIPDSVVSIDARMFEQCTGLTSVNFGRGLTYISGASFFNCTSLKSVTIPNTVTAINLGAFEACTSLTDVYYGGSEADWAKVQIKDYNEPLASAKIHCNEQASAVPVLISATASAGQITVKWNAVSGASKYAVYRKVSDGSWTLLSSTVTGTSYIDKSTDLKAGTTYIYTVKAYVDGAWGKYDAVGISAKAVAAAASTVPVLAGATATAAGQITVKWSAVTGAAKYAVYRKAAGESSWTRLTNTVTGTNYTDESSDLKAGTTYYYTVRAYVDGTWSGYDPDGVSATIAASTAPAIPVLVSATASAGQIKVTWEAVTGATKYAVYRKTSDGSWTLLTSTITGTSYTDKSTELKAGTTYIYTVKAYVNGAWGKYDATGVSAKAKVATPTLNSATVSAGQIKVTWKAVTGATKYAVYRKTSGGSWTLLTNTVTGTGYTDKSSDLKAGTTYYYTVKAYGGGAWGGYDKTGVSAKAVVATPVLVGATASLGQIKVTWKAVTGATKYAVYRKVSGGSWERLTNTVTGTSYTDKSTSLINGGTYYYTVKAYGGGAWGSNDKTGVSANAIVSTVPVLTGATASAWQIKVTWKAVAGALKYAVYRKAEGDTSWTRLSNTVTTTSFTDKSYQLHAGVTYYYTVKSYVDEWSDYDPKGVSAEVPLPDYPSLISATASTASITVKWEAVSEAMEYAVYRKIADGKWTYLTEGVTVNGTSYTDKSAKAGTTYIYTVRVKVRDAWSRYDAAGVSAVIPSAKIPILQSATARDGVVTIDWKAVNGGTKYAVYRKTAGGSWEHLDTLISGQTYYVDNSKELKIGTTYYYTVRALKDGAWGGYDQSGVSVKVK